MQGRLARSLTLSLALLVAGALPGCKVSATDFSPSTPFVTGRAKFAFPAGVEQKPKARLSVNVKPTIASAVNAKPTKLEVWNASDSLTQPFSASNPPNVAPALTATPTNGALAASWDVPVPSRADRKFWIHARVTLEDPNGTTRTRSFQFDWNVPSLRPGESKELPATAMRELPAAASQGRPVPAGATGTP